MFGFKKKKKEKETNKYFLLAGIVLLFAFILGTIQRLDVRPKEDFNLGNINVDNNIILNEATCGASGGSWNECGTTCRNGTDDEVCLQLCIETCECESDSECPFDFECGGYVENKGICQRVKK